MVGFEVIVNGERLCTAGSECVCGVGLTFSYREPELIRFNIGGIPHAGSMQHSVWKTPSVTIGDEITIRLVEITAPDTPDVVYDSNSQQGREDGC
ncbi:hypothetical protein I41_49780 [Lacipirellula limnantheis]|uniref:Uncharacterized protein n=1 Tax=Lacipirellula limnantheis TaxID=2528024 RepID=A0A517U545_9BACT|nr:hypothetical protein I41_49780 [Lacipirellula limnantheis]